MRYRKPWLKATSVAIILSFLSTNSAYPLDNTSLRALSFAESNLSRQGNPGNSAGRISALPAALEDSKTGRRKVSQGVCVATSRIIIGEGGLSHAQVEKPAVQDRGKKDAIGKTAELLNQALEVLARHQGQRIVSEAVAKSASGEARLTVEFMAGHDVLMDIFPARYDPQTPGNFRIRVDIDTAKDLKKHKDGLAVLMSTGLLYEFYRSAGLNEEDALLKLLEFCRLLDTEDTASFNALTEVLRQKGIDHNNVLRRFILAGVKEINEQKRRILVRQLMDTWHRAAVRDLLIFTKVEKVPLELSDAEREQRQRVRLAPEMEAPRMDNAGATIGTIGVTFPPRAKPAVETKALQAGDPRVSNAEAVIQEALALVLEASKDKKFKDTVKAPLKFMAGHNIPLNVALVDNLDHLMDVHTSDGVFCAEASRAALRIDSHTIENAPPECRRGLAVMASMGMVFYFYRRLGHSSLDAHRAMMDYFSALSKKDRAALMKLVSLPGFDCCGYLGEFLKDYPGLKRRTDEERTKSDREIQMLRARSLSGELPFDLSAARRVLEQAEEEGREFHTDTNTRLFSVVKDTFDDKKAQVYYRRLAAALRESGLIVTSQRGSRVAHTQGTILSAAKFVHIDRPVEDAADGLFSRVDHSADNIRAAIAALGQVWDRGTSCAGIVDGFCEALKIVKHDFGELKEGGTIPYAQVERLVRIAEAGRDQFLDQMRKALALQRKAVHTELKGPLRRKERNAILKRIRAVEKSLHDFEGRAQEGIDALMSCVDDAELSDIAFTFFVQRVSSRSGHHSPRLLLGRRIYIESDPEVERIRTQALANIDMAPHPKYVVPWSTFYSENASLTVKVRDGRPYIDWPNMEEILLEMAPYCYEAIKNGERNGWPMFTYQLETTVGGTYAALIQKTLEQVMTDMATVEASAVAQKKAAEKKAGYARRIADCADIVFRRYVLEGEVASVMEEEKVGREEAIGILLRKYRDAAGDVASLAVIREAGLEGEVEALVSNADFRAGIPAGAAFEATLYNKAYEQVLRNRRELKLRARNYIKNYVTYRDLTAAREAIDELGLDTRPYHVSSSGPGRRFNFVVKPSRIWFGPNEIGSVTDMYGQIISAEQLDALDGALELVQAVNSSIPCAHVFTSVEEGGTAKVIENTVRDVLHSLGTYVGDLVKAHGGDGRALRYAINTRKESHFLLWAATMVTGYCLTKEPVFILLMNEMTKDDMLNYLGVPQKHREHIKKEAARILEARSGFISTAEWEEWARQELSGDQLVRQYFGDLSDTEWVPRLDAISYLANKLMGEADGTSFQGIINEIAKWATYLLKIERQINDMACIAAVNDIFEAVERARQAQGPAAGVTPADRIKIGMQGSYKADVSDYRESANWYMFLVLTKQFGRIKNYMGSMISRISNIDRLLKELQESGKIQGYDELFKEMLELETSHMAAQDRILAIGSRLAELAASGVTDDGECRALRAEEAQLRSDEGARAEKIDEVNSRAAALDAKDIAQYAALLKEKLTITNSQEYREFSEATALTEAATCRLPIPGQIVFSDPYVPDSTQMMDGALKADAEKVKIKLKMLGFAAFEIPELTEEQITAQAAVDDFGTDLSKWPVLNAKLKELDGKASPEEAAAVRKRIAAIGKGDMVTLVSYVTDVGKDFFRDYQGCDVIILNSGHRELRSYVSNLPRVAMCMRIGNPGSAMVIRDSTQQSQGPLLDWNSILEWNALGGTYSCNDEHRDKIEAWRRDMAGERARALSLHAALISGNRDRAQRLLTDFAQELGDARNEKMKAALRSLLDQQKEIAKEIGMDGLVYDELIIQIDSFIKNPSLENFTFGMWLALGGRWALTGLPKEEIERQRAAFEDALDRSGIPRRRTKKAVAEQNRILDLFVKPQYELTQKEYAEVLEKFRGTTKAGDLPVLEAVDEIEWRQLQETRRQNSAKIQNGFNQTYQAISEQAGTLTAQGCVDDARSLVEGWETVLLEAARHDPQVDTKCVGDIIGGNSFHDFGRFQAHARLACEKYVGELLPQDDPLREKLMTHLADFFDGKEMSDKQYRALRGDHDKARGGDIGDLAEAPGISGNGERLEIVAAIGALIDQAYLIGQVIQVSNKNQLINVLSTYCDAIMNIHEADYPPYLFHYLSTNGFGFGSDYFRYPGKRREMYELSVRHYKWIHDYMRALVLAKTDMRDRGQEYVEDVLGDYRQGKASILYTQVGVEVPPNEILWDNMRALRDLVVKVHDRYGYPVVVKEVDPAVIGMDSDLYVAVGYPEGNTTTLTGVGEQQRLHNEGVKIIDEQGREVLIGVSTGMTPCPCKVPDQRPGRQGKSLHLAPASLTFLSPAQLQALGVAPPSTVDPRGVFTILKFKQDRMMPIAFVMNHFTSQNHVTFDYENAGLPVAWSNVAERMMYMKIALPGILAAAGVEAIPQLQVMRGTPEADIEKAINQFIKEGGIRVVMSKPSEQSGGRGAERFIVISGDKDKDKKTVRELVKFVHSFSKGDDVVVQMFLTSSPFVFGTKDFLREVQAEFAEKGRAVALNKIPATPLYWYMRTFPTQATGDDKSIAGWGLIVNTEAVANYGRGGTYFEGSPERVLKPEFASIVRQKMEEVTYKCLDAIERYAPQFVEDMLAKFESTRQEFEGKAQPVPEYVQRGIEQFTQLRAARKADDGGVSYARMISGLFDYMPYLTYKGKMVHFEPVLDPQGDMDIVLYIYDENGDVQKIPSSQEKILEALRRGDMEMGMQVKIGVIELNSGFGLVGPHQQQLVKLGMDRGELVLPIWHNMARRGYLCLKARGMAENLRVIDTPPEALPPALQAVHSTLSTAMQYAQAIVSREGKRAVDIDDMSLILCSYVAKRIQDSVGEITPEALQQPGMIFQMIELAARTLTQDRVALQARLGELRELYSGRTMPLILRKEWSTEFVRRISGIAIERLAHPNRPVVRVYEAADKMPIADFQRVIGDRPNMAVICGTLEGFISELSTLIADSAVHDTQTRGAINRNVLGILWNEGWIVRKKNKIFVYRAIVYDREQKTLKEVNFPRPLILNAAHDMTMTTNIPAEREMQIAQDISRQMALCGVLQVNPIAGSERAYDKASMYRAMAREGIDVPRTFFIPQTAAADTEAVALAVTGFVERERRLDRAEVIVKPNSSTEARGASVCSDSATARMNVTQLLRTGSALLQSSEGTAAYFDEAQSAAGHRRLVLRVNVAWDGNDFVAESGYAQIASNPGEAVVSKSRGAGIFDINKTLKRIYYKKRNGEWTRLELTAAHIAAIKEAAEKASMVIDKKLGVEDMLKLIGVDIVLNVSENQAGEIEFTPVVLEGNARPAGLSNSAVISDAPIDEGAYTPTLCATKALWGYTRAEGLRSKPQDITAAVSRIVADRPLGQTAAIKQQLQDLLRLAVKSGFDNRARAGLGVAVAGGRLRVQIMHPDMARFFGPAVQMPIGAREAQGREQIAVFAQEADDNKIHVHTENPEYQQTPDWIWANQFMYPGPSVKTMSDYEQFGTRMSENILVSLGYYSDGQLQEMEAARQALPPKHMWAKNNMRRTVILVANAIASLRTLRDGPEGERVQAALGAGNFQGMRICINGEIPRGGFSTSSAVVVAVLDAINAFYDLGLSDDTIIDIACQAEYGTGVRAGSLDQTAIQKGVAGKGLLISSNPAERYKTIEAYEIDSERFGVVFPYSVARDTETAAWSNGIFTPQTTAEGRLASGEVRKMTGKAAEISAILLHLPLDTSFFQEIENDLVAAGGLGPENLRKVYGYLRQIPALISLDDLKQQVYANKDWYIDQLVEHKHISRADAAQEAERTFSGLFNGWQEPLMSRTDDSGEVITEQGVPLRAMLAYLYGEVAKNLYALHHPDQRIEYVSRSQMGDRSFDINFSALPTREEMEQPLNWEGGLAGPQLMEAWLRRFGARPFNYNKGLDDASLETATAQNTQLHLMKGSNFFRGLALIDLIEAMLRRAFGDDAIAVRVNAAGQGDFFQVHVDSTKVDMAEVKHFMEKAIYRRFGLNPAQKFVDAYPGGPAAGIRLDRLEQVPEVNAAITAHLAAGPRPRTGDTRQDPALQAAVEAI